jgi:hypothetical protein
MSDEIASPVRLLVLRGKTPRHTAGFTCDPLPHIFLGMVIQVKAASAPGEGSVET